MQFQAAVNAGQNKGLTLERKINLMLENGFNVFILRWKKIYPFPVSTFGYEIMTFMQRTSRGNLETSFAPIVERGEITFDPDEMDVPVAYLVDTPYNRKLLATVHYIAQFTVNGLITPSGTINKDVVNAQIGKYAEELGIKMPVRTKMVGVYGNSLPVGTNLGKVNDMGKAAAETPDVSKSVFANKETMDAVVTESTLKPAVADAPMQGKPVLTADECIQQGELSAITRFQPLVDKLQKEKKKYWKSSQYYRDIILPEIKKETARLLLENGLPLEAPAPTENAKDAPEPAAVPGDVAGVAEKEAVTA